MKIKDIELANISRFRGELMGAAMLFIILFHVPLERSSEFFGLRRCGNVGVDMFLFLSGIGLWFSWVKNPSVWQFYKRRLLRIYPAWLVMASLYYIPRFDWAQGDYLDLIGDITINWDFWMPVLMILWCIWVQWIAPLHQVFGHIEIFWSRVPIFFIGINCGELVRRETKIDGAGIWMILFLFLATFSSCFYLEQVTHGRFPLFVERMIYIPFTITLILMLNRVFRRTPKWFNRFCAFFGALSLEAYLIHDHFVLTYITPYNLGYWPTALLTIVITIPLAWLLQKALKLLVRI